MLAMLTALALASGPGAVPTTVPPMRYSEIVAQAELIFTGSAVKSVCRIEEGGKTIRTFVTFTNLAFTKGQHQGDLVLQIEGGEVGEERLVVPEIPKFKVGSRYLLYVVANGKNISPIVGFHQGAFEFAERNGREVLLNLRGEELIGVQNDRFVFLAPAAPAPAVRAPEAVLANTTVKPADADVAAKEEAMVRARREREQIHSRPLDIAVTPAVRPGPAANTPPAGTTPARSTEPGVDASPIYVKPGQDPGIRASAQLLLDMAARQGGK